MHVPPYRQRTQHVEMPCGQPRQLKERQPRRQLDKPRLLPQPRTRTLDPFGRIRNPDPRAQPPPKLRLPDTINGKRAPVPIPVLPPRPSAAVSGRCNAYRSNELGEMSNRAEPPSASCRIHRVAPAPEVRGQARHPRLLQTPVNNIEQSPNCPLGKPRIRVSIDPGRRSDRVTDEPPRRRKLDVRARHRLARPPPRANPTSAARATAPSRGWALRQPPPRTDRTTDRPAAHAGPRPRRRPAQLDGCGALRRILAGGGVSSILRGH